MEAHEGEPLPNALRDKPRVPDHLLHYWNGFFDLKADRQVFMGGASEISFVAIDRWGERHGLVGDAFERFKALIRRLDAIWLEDIAEKVKAATPKT